MNFEPQKFFIGLMAFFSILLPGAVLTYLLRDSVGPVLLGSTSWHSLSDTAGPLVFFVCSYLVGHLVFLAGAWWLDEFYDRARGHTRKSIIEGLSRRRHLMPRMGRALVWLMFKDEANVAVDRAAAIKRELLKGVQGRRAINTFQWSKSWLTVESAASLEQVHQFEADSKFFRSFVVVLVILIVAWSVIPDMNDRAWHIIIAACVLPLALWRYMEQRLKATNQAYWAVITLVARDPKIALPTKTAKPDDPTHAGGVVFRRHNGNVEYLLVEEKKNPDRWVLPKGHCEADESPAETAVREVQEETGVWAAVIAELATEKWTDGDEKETICFFLMERLGSGRAKDQDRRHRWIDLKSLGANNLYPETKVLMHHADALRASGGKALPSVGEAGGQPDSRP